MLKRFAYHGVTVSDLDKSVAFYRDLMHMKLERTYELAGKALEEATGFPGAHIKVAVLNSDGNFLKLIQYLFPEGKKSFEAKVCDVGASHFAMGVDNVKEVYEELRAKGIKFLSPPIYPYPDNQKVFFTYMLDPDGMMVELHRGVEHEGYISFTWHHSYTVSDLDRGLAFYRDILGLKALRTRQPKGKGIEEGMSLSGIDFTLVHTGFDLDESLELFHFVHPKGKQQSDLRLCDVGCSHVAFDVDDIQQDYEKFLAKGAKFISPPVRLAADGLEVTMAYILDPDNNVVELRCGELP